MFQGFFNPRISEVLNGSAPNLNPDRQTNSGAAVTHRDSESSLPTIFLGQSGESVSDEDDSERRNSAPGQRRGSKLIELFDNKKRKQPIKYRDKQGKNNT